MRGLRAGGYEVDAEEFWSFIRAGPEKFLSKDEDVRALLTSLPQVTRCQCYPDQPFVFSHIKHIRRWGLQTVSRNRFSELTSWTQSANLSRYWVPRVALSVVLFLDAVSPFTMRLTVDVGTDAPFSGLRHVCRPLLAGGVCEDYRIYQARPTENSLLRGLTKEPEDCEGFGHDHRSDFWPDAGGGGRSKSGSTLLYCLGRGRGSIVMRDGYR
eukprot:7209253-Pyramimonas_sp.AAC.1